LEDVLGDDAVVLLRDEAATGTMSLLSEFLQAQPEWETMATEERLAVVFDIFKMLSYGAVEITHMDGTSTRLVSPTSYLANGYLVNAAQWRWPVVRKKPFCHDMCGHLQAAFAMANGIPLDKVCVTETECRAAGAEACVFEVEVSQ
jgi:hypothetical protein